MPDVDGRPRVLVVDDEQRSLELLVRALRSHAEVTTASSGPEAWEAFKEKRFDVVLTDQRMPGMSGADLLTRIAEADENVGRIVLTGYSDLESSIQAINRGRVHAYLNKPCPPHDLAMAVKAVYERVNLTRHNRRLVTLIGEQNVVLQETLGLVRDGLDDVRGIADRLSTDTDPAGRGRDLLARLDELQALVEKRVGEGIVGARDPALNPER